MEIKKVEWPQRTCRDAVFGDLGQGYTCELHDEHKGPCVSLSVKASIQRREAWEKANQAATEETR